MIKLKLFRLTSRLFCMAVATVLVASVASCAGKGKSSKQKNPLEAYVGFTNDSALAVQQYNAIKPAIKTIYVSDRVKEPELENLMGASQSFVAGDKGMTICWAFEFNAPQLADAPFYHNVLFVIDSVGWYYNYDEMYQRREDQYLRLSALKLDGKWLPAVPYIEPAWKCVGYESCNRYGGKAVMTQGWENFMDAAQKLGIQLDMETLPFVKRQEENKEDKNVNQ